MEAELADGTILEFPDGTDPEIVKAAVKKYLAKPVDFDAMEMVGNIPRSAKNFGRDMIHPFVHPIETAKSLGNLAMGVGEKLIPGEQEHEVYADATGQMIADRYGSVNALKRTAMNDPVGMLSDAAGIATVGGGLAAKAPGTVGKVGRAVQTVGKAIDPVNLAMNTAKAGLGVLTPNGLPASLYESSAKFRPSIDPAQRRSMTDTALREGIMPTSAGLAKAHGIIREINTQIDSLIDDATNRGVSVSRENLYQHLGKVKGKLGGVKLNAADDLSVVDSIADALDEHLEKLGKDSLTPRELQEFKKDAYTRINFDIQQGQASFAKNETAKALAKAAKEEVEKVDPRVQSLNKRQGELLELREEVERSANRIENRDVVGIGAPLKIAAGAAGNAATTAIGTAAGILDAPKPKAKLALWLHEAKQFPQVFTSNEALPLLLRQGLVQSGRLDEELQALVDALRSTNGSLAQ